MGCGVSAPKIPEQFKGRRLDQRMEKRLAAANVIAALSKSAVASPGKLLASGKGTVRFLDRQLTRTFSSMNMTGIEAARAATIAKASARQAANEAATAAIIKDLGKWLQLVQCVRVFSEMGQAEQEVVVRNAFVEVYKAGEVIYDEGQPGHDCYVVESGLVVASMHIWSVAHYNSKEWRQMRTYKAKQCFGERGLVRTEPRRLRMTCQGDVSLLRIPATTYVQCMHMKERKENLLRNVGQFETMTDDQLSKLGALLRTRSFADGESIAVEAQPAHCCWIIESGMATTSGGSGSNTFGVGSAFAERALLEDSVYEATLTAVGPVTTYQLFRQDVEAKLGQLSQLQAEQFEVRAPGPLRYQPHRTRTDDFILLYAACRWIHASYCLTFTRWAMLPGRRAY